MYKAVLRKLLRMWSGVGIAPGLLYQYVEGHGGTLAEGPLETRLFNGCKIKCDLKNCVQRAIYFYGAYEPMEACLFSRLIKGDSVVFDIGANVGQYTLIAARKLGRPGQVHAFEPYVGNCSAIAEALKANTLDGVASLNNVGAWNKSGTLSFHLTKSDLGDNETNFSIAHGKVEERPFQCQVLKLDEYAENKNLQRVDVVKMDIEGAELMALEGMAGLLRAHKPFILLEVNQSRCATLGYHTQDLFKFLAGMGYAFMKIGATPALQFTLTTFEGLEQCNVLAHARPLPEHILEGFTLKKILRKFAKRSETLISV